MTNLTQNYFIL